jgi:kynurenine 3-monooxygenase
MFPSWFIPLYTMISFTLIPYAEARNRARRQSRGVRTVLVGLVVLLLALLGVWLALRA